MVANMVFLFGWQCGTVAEAAQRDVGGCCGGRAETFFATVAGQQGEKENAACAGQHAGFMPRFPSDWVYYSAVSSSTQLA